ncbi:Translation machinery-associated protein 10 [Cyberlindnera fabianii]|uniref:Translation machinery-associated protein 10 n=1 Tax=Cyberlindnera fabianii TaxID=36022 RepID=A0A1V2LD18_CYBFA|nr:Translation machinery-associated protein 10 [Cyberlindnera fabianii]
MTRTHKWTFHESKAEPHFFTHNGHPGQDPTKTKKNGAGKGNWGAPGDEIEDLIESGEIPPVFNKSRRGF